MARTVKNVKNSLKFKASVRENILSVRLGVKKYSIPVQARLLSDGEYLFLSFSASSELYRIDGKKLMPMKPEEDAGAAYAALNPGRKRGRRRSHPVLPAQLAAALKTIPEGFRLGFDASGKARLVKKRVRSRGA